MKGRPISTIKNKDGKTVGHVGKPIVVNIDQLKNNPGEPPMRIDWENPRYERELTALMNSIHTHGLQKPITITKDYVITDGHRRTITCTKLGYTQIPAYIAPTTQNGQDAFIVTNTKRKAIDGYQYLWRYMNDHSVPPTYLSRIKQLEKWLGKTFAHGLFNRILVRHGSANTYAFAMGIYRKQLQKNRKKYNKLLLKGHMRDLVYYMLNVGNATEVKNAIYSFIPTDTLILCIKERKRINNVFTVK
tara:strand:- start:1641 stop:2378 length:738 start_codon:yes stop_codon:yes gene_type:complete